MTNINISHADLRQFTGTENVYRHPLVRNVVYTDGVKYLAEHASCYWLLDKIATLQMEPRIRAEEFQVWKLSVTENVGTLTVEDGNGNAVYSEHLSFTDFPLPEIEIWFSNGTMLLPSEY